MRILALPSLVCQFTERQESTMQPFGDNFIPVIYSHDGLEHTEEYPFCLDGTCPCHEDESSISKVNEYVQEGLLTEEEATRTIKGEML